MVRFSIVYYQLQCVKLQLIIYLFTTESTTHYVIATSPVRDCSSAGVYTSSLNPITIKCTVCIVWLSNRLQAAWREFISVDVLEDGSILTCL